MCSSSYSNQHGVREGFILDNERRSLAFTARSHDPARGMADTLYLVELVAEGEDTPQIKRQKMVPVPLGAAAIVPASGKGCHVPIALVGSTLVYHFRSPTEVGDLWVHDKA